MKILLCAKTFIYDEYKYIYIQTYNSKYSRRITMKQLTIFDGIECKPLSPEEKAIYKEMEKRRSERAFLNYIKERSEKLEIWLKRGMSIDRQKTFDEKHYWVEDLSPVSHKNVWAVCTHCRKGRWVKYYQYRDLCLSCAKIGENLSEETHKKLSESQSGENNPFFGKHHMEESLKKMSESHIGKNNPCYGRTGKKHPLYGTHPSEETRIKHSCTMRGISVEEFDGFVRYGKYCPKFNESLKERIRDKYKRKCLMCGMSEEEHIRRYGCKISMHHVDYNKQCGCDGNECRLVPLCSACHAKTSGGRRSYWEEVIMKKVLEIFPDINFDNPQTTLEDFYMTSQEMQHRVKISNLVKSIIKQCVNYPPNPYLSRQRSLLDF